MRTGAAELSVPDGLGIASHYQGSNGLSILGLTVDSPHLRHVSAPLSRQGISILYQSSYFTDFLLVKETDFGKASAIFAEQGCGFHQYRLRAHGSGLITGHVDPTPAPSHSKRRSYASTPRTPLSPPAPLSGPAVVRDSDSRVPEITVLPSPLACVGFSHALEKATAERIRQLVVWPEQARRAWYRKRASYPLVSPRTPVSASSHGYAPSGVNDKEDLGRPFLSYTRTEDGASITTETRILRWMFGRKTKGSGYVAPGVGVYGGFGGSDGSDEGDVDDKAYFDNPEADKGDGEDAEEGEGVDEEEDQGVIEGTEFQLGGVLAAGYNTDSTDLGESEAEVENEARLARSTVSEDTGAKTPITPTTFSLPTTPRLSPGPLNTPIAISWSKAASRRRSVMSALSAVSAASDQVVHKRARSEKRPGRKRCLQLDLRGVYSSHESISDSPMTTTTSKGYFEKAAPLPDLSPDLTATPRLSPPPPHADPEATPTASGQPQSRADASTQDLKTAQKPKENVHTTYHLDKSGLVTLFSDLLNSQNIRMLYSSTFHTANILVEARDVSKAKKLLNGNGGRSSRSGSGSAPCS